MGSRLGVAKVAAARVGLTLDDYLARLSSGCKHCRKCRIWKVVGDFNRDLSRSDGLAALCRTCQKGGPKQRQLLNETPNEAQRRRYRTDPVYRAKTIARVRARKRGIDPIDVEDMAFHMNRTNGLCLYCDEPADSWDHMVPISKSGSSRRHNVAPCCRRCNSRKRDKDFHQFIEDCGIPLTDRLISFIENAVALGDLEA